MAEQAVLFGDLDRSVYFIPDRSLILGSGTRSLPKQTHFVKLRKEDSAIWTDGSLSMSTEELEAECDPGAHAEGLSRNEYLARSDNGSLRLQHMCLGPGSLPRCTAVDAPKCRGALDVPEDQRILPTE